MASSLVAAIRSDSPPVQRSVPAPSYRAVWWAWCCSSSPKPCSSPVSSVRSLFSGARRRSGPLPDSRDSPSQPRARRRSLFSRAASRRSRRGAPSREMPLRCRGGSACPSASASCSWPFRALNGLASSSSASPHAPACTGPRFTRSSGSMRRTWLRHWSSCWWSGSDESDARHSRARRRRSPCLDVLALRGRRLASSLRAALRTVAAVRWMRRARRGCQPRSPGRFSASVAARGVAIACPFCASGAVGTGSHYLVATIVMLALPLGLIGGFALWVRRSVRPADPLRAPTLPSRATLRDATVGWAPRFKRSTNIRIPNGRDPTDI